MLEREPFSLQHLYMDVEVAAAVGVRPATISNQGFNGPPAAGHVGRRKYSLRSEVEQRVRDTPETLRQRRGSTTPGHDR